ncbi:MAG: PEP-CTERM sorting domain-containing protein [Planctomycetaceae bacterium]|nr:PEP-CTERM sorting domain-containing protein [Planctomycetaceae bacterium]
MKKSIILLALLILTASRSAHADKIIGGSMTHNLDSAAFRDPASADEAYWASLGVTLTPNEPILIFGNHRGPAETSGQGILAFRPQPTNPALPDIADPDLPRPNYRDDAVSIEASITAFGSTSALAFGVNGTVTPSGLPGRLEQSTTFSFDPTNAAATATGAIGLDGVTSFWYANAAVVNTQSVWMCYGDLLLSFDAARAIDGNSGWVFINNLLYTDTPYDIRNFAISSVVAATNSTPGSLTITGDLYTAPGLAAFGIDAGLAAGTFTLNAVTAVPEPATSLVMGVGFFGWASLVRRRVAR